jgi:hypothetical protein
MTFDAIRGMPSNLFADLGLVVRGRPAAWAVYSPCEMYRYVLGREWDLDRPTLVNCALNPSTATETVVDPTIRKDIGFAKRDGFGCLIKINAFALRATDPKELERSRREWSGKDQRGPVGDHNDVVIRATLDLLDHVCVVAAWGRGPSAALRPRFREVLALLSHNDTTVRCYGTNNDGSPKHPLYLPNNTPLVLYDP